MPELATLSLEIQRTQVEQATRALDALVQRGDMAGDMARRLKADFASGAISADQLAGATAKLAPALSEGAQSFRAIHSAGMTWTQFLKANMGPAMAQFGGHAVAIKELGAEWRALTATGAQGAAQVDRLTASIQRMRQAAAQSGANAMAAQIQQLDVFQQHATASTGRAVVGYGHLERAFTTAGLAAAGLGGRAAHLGSSLLLFGTSGAVTASVVAGVAAMGLAWRALSGPQQAFTEGLKAAREEADRLRESTRAQLFLQAELIQLEVDATRRRLAQVPRQGAGALTTIAALEQQIATDEARIASLRTAAWEDTMRQIDEASDKRQSGIEKELQGIRTLHERETERFLAAEHALVRLARLAEQARRGIMPTAGELPGLGLGGVIQTIPLRNVQPGRPGHRGLGTLGPTQRLDDFAIASFFTDQMRQLGGVPGALAGGASGALAGFAAGGPLGAVLGGVSGLVGGILGLGSASREAAERMREMRLEVSRTMAELRAELAGQGLSADLARAAGEFANLRKQIDVAVPALGEAQRLMLRQAGVDPNDPRFSAERNQLLAEAARLERERADQLVRSNAALADSIADFANLRVQILAQLPTRGWEWVAGALADLEELEAAWRAQQAALQARAMEDLQVRLLRAEGLTEEADALALQIAQQREYQAALEAGADAAQLALLNEVHLAETRERMMREAARQIGDLERDINQLRGLSSGLREASILAGARFGSPLAQTQSARMLFEQTAALARAGDRTAAGRLPALAESLLDASRAYNASGLGFVRDVQFVQGVLNEMADRFDDEADLLQRQIDLLEEIRDELVAGPTDQNMPPYQGAPPRIAPSGGGGAVGYSDYLLQSGFATLDARLAGVEQAILTGNRILEGAPLN